MEFNQVHKLDQEIFALVNKVRADPKILLPHLQGMLVNFEDTLYKREGQKPNIRTKEGASGVQTAIEFLTHQTSLPPLTWNADLTLAAKAHVDDIGPKGLLQHESSNGESVKDRFGHYGKFVGCYGENLSFNCDTAEEVVSQLIIDDGLPERGHRDNIFNKEFKVFGCYSGPHKDFEMMTCMDLAGGFVKNGEPDPIELQMDRFLKEPIEIEMPQNVISWKQNSKVNV